MQSLDHFDNAAVPNGASAVFPGLVPMEAALRDGGAPPQPGGLQRPSDPPHPAWILVSSNRKSVSYINLAKRFLQEHGEVQLSALGIAISSMVTVAEILKNKQLAEESRITTSLEWLSAESRVRHKPKMTVVLTKSARFDETIMAEGAHGSYANDDEDTYEDADYSDAAFQDPRVPDVGEGDMNQLPDEAMARAPLGPAPSEVLHPSTRFLNDDGTRGGGVPTGRSETSPGGRPVGGGMPNMGSIGAGRGGGGGMGGYGQVYPDPGLGAMYSQTQHQQRAQPSPLPQQLLSQQQRLGAQMDLRTGYSGDMRSAYGGSNFRQSPGPQHTFDAHPPPPPPRQSQQQHQQPWQGQAEPPSAAGLPLHGGLNAFQQPPQQQQPIASPSPQSPETSSQSGSHTYHFGQMQGALTDAAALAPPAALGDVGDVPDADALRAGVDRDLRQ